MNTTDLVAEIDAEIARLQKVRILLAGTGASSASKKRSMAAGLPVKTAKRRLSPEARERIRNAQIKRWAAAKKAADVTTANKRSTSQKASATRTGKAK